MRTLILTRSPGDNQGIPGVLHDVGAVHEPPLRLVTLEPPWRDNKPGVSCIPPGKYVCKPHVSPRFGKCILVTDVPGRTDILSHSGNWAGDKARGYRSDSQGCILVGLMAGELQGQRAVIGSREAMNSLLAWAGEEEFELEITGGIE